MPEVNARGGRTRPDVPAWRKALRPRPKLRPSQWAEKHLVLSSRYAAEPGPIDLNQTPYSREQLDAFDEPGVESITLVQGPQTGKTTTVKGMIGYAVDHDPGPAMYVLQAADKVKLFAKDHLHPMFRECPALAAHTTGRPGDLGLKQLYLDQMSLYLEGAGSPGNMASRPIRYLFLDEIDKYHGETEREASSADLAEKRTRTFRHRKRIVKTSTPTTKDGAIWQAWLKSDQRRYHVPCPHCGELQTLEFRQLDFKHCRRDDRTWDLERVEAETVYRCVGCKGAITDGHKPGMLSHPAAGWVAKHPERKKHRGYHLSSLYSPWMPFGEIARKFLEAKAAGPEKLHDFFNNELAEPFEGVSHAADEEQILRHKGDYGPNQVPEKVRHLILTVDKQDAGYWYVLRGWTRFGTSYLVDYGLAEDDAMLDQLYLQPYGSPRGPIRVTRAFMDSGDGEHTEEVYDFCRKRPRWLPLKGDTRGDPTLTIRLRLLKEKRVKLLRVNVNHYKDALQYKLHTPLGVPGAWYLHDQVGVEYAHHLTAEAPVEERDKWGHHQRRWKKQAPENHYLDCEVYQLAAADLLGVRYRRPSKKRGSANVCSDAEDGRGRKRNFATEGGRDWQ